MIKLIMESNGSVVLKSVNSDGVWYFVKSATKNKTFWSKSISNVNEFAKKESALNKLYTVLRRLPENAFYDDEDDLLYGIEDADELKNAKFAKFYIVDTNGKEIEDVSAEVRKHLLSDDEFISGLMDGLVDDFDESVKSVTKSSCKEDFVFTDSDYGRCIAEEVANIMQDMDWRDNLNGNYDTYDEEWDAYVDQVLEQLESDPQEVIDWLEDEDGSDVNASLIRNITKYFMNQNESIKHSGRVMKEGSWDDDEYTDENGYLTEDHADYLECNITLTLETFHDDISRIREYIIEDACRSDDYNKISLGNYKMYDRDEELVDLDGDPYEFDGQNVVDLVVRFCVDENGEYDFIEYGMDEAIRAIRRYLFY